MSHAARAALAGRRLQLFPCLWAGVGVCHGLKPTARPIAATSTAYCCATYLHATPASQEALQAKEPPRPDFAAEEAAAAATAAEDGPMYFQQPGQLLGVFSQLEEGNLFLIQNCQVGRGRG